MELEKTETEIKKEITDYLKGIGWKVYRMHASRISKKMQMCEPGTPDLFTVGYNGDHMFIEVKKNGGKVSLIQKKHIADLQGRGWNVLIAKSINDIQRYIK